MLIPLFARVAGFKIENFWRRGSRTFVRCTARLSRRLLAEEAERVERLTEASVEETEVVRDCSPDEVEQWQTKLIEVLAAGATAGALRKIAVGGRRSRRGPQKPSIPPLPPPDSAA